jgi:hypothetical protein
MRLRWRVMNPRPRKTISDKQIAANRRNALQSTGPRTPQGRAVSRRNALQHGILSKQVLVCGLNLQESAGELEALHRRFWEELQPAGPVEEMLVDQIVTAHWRLRRALTAESGEIALHMDAGQRQHRRAPHPAQQWAQWTMLGDPIAAMEESSLGNALLGSWLREVRDAVEAEGALTERAVQKLAGHFQGQPASLVRELEAFRRKLVAEPTEPEGEPKGSRAESDGPAAALRERQKIETLAFLDGKIGGFRRQEERLDEEEDYEGEARQAAAVLPSAETLDKILRYETKLERQMYRAMAQLERVQRMRLGETIPAPLSVEISDRG